MQTPKRGGLALPWPSRIAARAKGEESRMSSLGAIRSLSKPFNPYMLARLVIGQQRRAPAGGLVPGERRQLGRSATKTRI